jgi:virginiamycin B lyase
MRALMMAGLLSSFLLPDPAAANEATGGDEVVKEWPVEWGGRPRDPYVAPDGTVWFVGQAGNYIGSFDPARERFRRHEIEDGTNPHTLIVDGEGIVWYAGNRNARIGRLDPKSGDIRTFPTGEARDPHTMVFDGKGRIWFTAQQSNRVGRLDMATGQVELVTPHETPARPYGIVLDPHGDPWVALLGTHKVVRIDAESLELEHYDEASPESRARRIEVTRDGTVWYGDEARGYLGRIDPKTGAVKEYPMPGGKESRPYALTRDGQGRLWVSQSGPDKKLVAFDPRSARFVEVHDVSHTVRHMMFDPETRALWFGTDAQKLGRVLTGDGS